MDSTNVIQDAIKNSKYQEDFFRNFNGTSAWETFSLIYPTSLITFIAITMSSIIMEHLTISKFKTISSQFLIDFVIIIIPMILSITVLEEYTFHYVIFLMIIATLIFFFYRSKVSYNKIPSSYINESKKYFITNARASITILSCIAILAVDFKIFPRRFAKTETFGYSLMDVGVGLFVFSNGIVSAEVRNKPQTLLRSFNSTIPLWMLGIGRFFVTKETDYYVPVSEYGVHWNFFITLAVTKVICSMILNIISIKNSLYISIFVLIFHEWLIQAGLGNWVLGVSPRNNFVQANREGISASLGYVGLYFLSVYIGKIMLKQNSQNLSLKLLFSSAAFLIVNLFSSKYFGISRRLANIGYCSWVMFLGTFMCFLFLLGENISGYLYRLTAKKTKLFVPLIYEAANYNGLVYFLLSNVLTGFVNLNIKTINVQSLYSVIILIVYKFIICFVVSFLYVKNIKLKVW